MIFQPYMILSQK